MTIARSCAAAFALAWTCYAICEALWVAAIVLLGISTAAAPVSADPWVGLALLGAYPAAGALTGLLFGLLAARFSNAAALRDALPTFASLSVVAVLYLHLSNEFALGVSGLTLLAALLTLAAVALVPALRASVLGHPVVLIPLAVAFVGITRVALVSANLGPRLAACAVALAAALAVAAALRTRIAAANFSARVPVAVAAGISIFLLVTAGRGDTPPKLPASVSNGAAPPILMIVLDTVRADHLSLYGYARETDPQLVDFAKHAWVYESALMPSDMTLTSHVSMFTGRLVANHRVVPSSPVLGAELTTLAEVLQSGGYSTYGIVSNCGYLHENNGIAQGFDYWDARCGRSSFNPVHPALLRSRVLESVRKRFFPERGSYAWRPAREISDEALDLVDRFGGGTDPFLLFLNYMDVHRPIHPPSEYRDLFPGRIDNFDMQIDWSALHRGGPNGRSASPEEKAHLASQYDGALRYLDLELGRLLDGLRARGVLDDALVIITSDHGESFGSHGLFGHGSSVYQDVVHVPLVVKWPASMSGADGKRRRITIPVSGIDLLPTIAEVAGLTVPEGVDGRSLLAPADEHRGIISESAESKGLPMRSLLRGSTKLLEREGRLELYDLATDPAETTNVLAVRSALAEELAAQLREAVDQKEAVAPRAPINPADAARLRALGYLE